MSDFMIVLRGSSDEFEGKSPEEIELIMQKYGSWVGELQEKNIFRGGSELVGKSRFLFVEDETIQVTDGPYVETKECLNGYFIISASSMEEAVEIAKGCPALTHGDTIEIRPHESC
ncbi:YciI family protein, partial [bacterium]|nr:YciI family protein [bacterium]